MTEKSTSNAIDTNMGLYDNSTVQPTNTYTLVSTTELSPLQCLPSLKLQANVSRFNAHK